MRLDEFPLLGSEHATRVRLRIVQDRYHNEAMTRGVAGITDLVRRRYIRRLEKEMAFYFWLLKDYAANTSKVQHDTQCDALFRMVCGAPPRTVIIAIAVFTVVSAALIQAVFGGR